MGNKVFFIGSVEHQDKLNQSEIKNAQIIATRELEKLVITNFEIFPERSINFKFVEMNGRVSIEFQLKNGEYLAVGDAEG